MPIDLNLLKKLSDYDIDLDYARKCIEANKHNQVTATYYLLLRKHIKEGGESVADSRKPSFTQQVFLKRVPNLRNLLLQPISPCGLPETPPKEQYVDKDFKKLSKEDLEGEKNGANQTRAGNTSLNFTTI